MDMLEIQLLKNSIDTIKGFSKSFCQTGRRAWMSDEMTVKMQTLQMPSHLSFLIWL
jgi:hypothetical protein